MLRYLLRRLLWTVPTLFGISVVVFLLIHLTPGDPSAFQSIDMAGGTQTVGGDTGEAVARFRREHLLDRSLWRQYLHYLGPIDLGPEGHPWFGGRGESPWGGLLVGDLGVEFRRPQISVASEIGRRLAVSLPLALLSILFSYGVALAFGIFSAVYRGSLADRLGTSLFFVLYAIPTFWGGLLLQLALGRTGLGWLPVLGLHDPDARSLGTLAYALDYLRHLVLPVLCTSYVSFAYLSRQMRTGMLEALQADYVRTARAKGLPEKVVVLKHALRNSLLPVLTLMSSILPILIGGSIVVEVVFNIPGMGKYAFDALNLREYNVIMGTVLLSALMTVLGILLSDLAYAWADPRIRYE